MYSNTYYEGRKLLLFFGTDEKKNLCCIVCNFVCVSVVRMSVE